MAKKHSSKTATKESIAASEPKLQTFSGWNGINISEAAPNWTPLPDNVDHNNQTNLAFNYLLVQNNVDATPTLGLKTRRKDVVLVNSFNDFESGSCEFTGVTYIKGESLFSAQSFEGIDGNRCEAILVTFLSDDTGMKEQWTQLDFEMSDGTFYDYTTDHINHIYSYINNGVEYLIVLTEDSSGKRYIWYGSMENFDETHYIRLIKPSKIEGNRSPSNFEIGLIGISAVSDRTAAIDQYTFGISYVNKFGQSEILSEGCKSVYTDTSFVNFSSSKYMTFTIKNIPAGTQSVSIYAQINESTEWTFIGNAPVFNTLVSGATVKRARYVWYGSLQNVGDWSDANLYPDTVNTTDGPHAKYCRMHDGRLYFWGIEDKPYRLVIGGDSSFELCLATGHGGGYIDIEPGYGTIVNGTYKWKTTSGATIVTVLCGNENTSLHKRFNLIEDRMSYDSSSYDTSWTVEEIANTVGCQSNWGAGVWADGFYVLTRYGLTDTTMTMEYNTQIQSPLISEQVQPIFTAELGKYMDKARMIQSNNIVYICFAQDDSKMDNVILCYDMLRKAWFTYTYLPKNMSNDILHIFNVDYIGAKEGIGIVCKDHIGFIPNTGNDGIDNNQKVDFLIETGEISGSVPTQGTNYVAQLEFRFDWFIGDAEIELVGTDYYGRRVTIKKRIHTDEPINELTDWMRVNSYLENYHLKIRSVGDGAQFKLTHIIAKVYTNSNKIGITRGYDSLYMLKDHHGRSRQMHHYIKNYANLREVLLP